jgi:hypothetical protein
MHCMKEIWHPKNMSHSYALFKGRVADDTLALALCRLAHLEPTFLIAEVTWLWLCIRSVPHVCL